MWKFGTAKLRRTKKKHSRVEAAEVLDDLREEVGVPRQARDLIALKGSPADHS